MNPERGVRQPNPGASAPLACIALGSNIGDSRQIILSAMRRLERLSSGPLLCSSLWKTSPVNCPPGSPPFVNAVVALTPISGETPETLLAKLREIELEYGRQPNPVRNAPRPLDLDLLTFGSETRDTTELKLPHPRAHVRRFVLAPLAEIAPDLVLPLQAKPVRELLQELSGSEEVSPLL